MYSELALTNQPASSESLNSVRFVAAAKRHVAAKHNILCNPLRVVPTLSGTVPQASTDSATTQKNLSSPAAMISTKNNSESLASKKSESERRATNNITTPDTTSALYVTGNQPTNPRIPGQQQPNDRRNLLILSRK
jgi:hypothetical protein